MIKSILITVPHCMSRSSLQELRGETAQHVKDWMACDAAQAIYDALTRALPSVRVQIMFADRTRFDPASMRIVCDLNRRETHRSARCISAGPFIRDFWKIRDEEISKYGRQFMLIDMHSFDVNSDLESSYSSQKDVYLLWGGDLSNTPRYVRTLAQILRAIVFRGGDNELMNSTLENGGSAILVEVRDQRDWSQEQLQALGNDFVAWIQDIR